MTTRLLALIDPAQVARRAPIAVDPEALDAARTILNDLESRGDSAALEHAQRLGDLSPGAKVLYIPADLDAARRSLSAADRALVERTAERIRAFAAAQRSCLTDLTFPIPGGRAGHECIPVRSAGCYAPGGRYPLPSSVLMTAVTARAAGVEHVWVASPRPTAATLAAASISGANGLLALGGAQAIGALTFGLLGAPPCDTIVGPGNRYVTAAKQLVSHRVGIDMLAGPSELLVLADDTADPDLIAADLLAQAEHDTDAVPILITTDAALPARVETALRARLETLPTHATAEVALRNGFATIAPSLDAAIALCDTIGPEHLEVMTRNADSISRRIHNAGAVFIGPASAEVFGDYGAGPNHVLPTGGTSRFRAGLSVFTFLRTRTRLTIDDTSAGAPLRLDAAALARIESLEAHARAAEAR